MNDAPNAIFACDVQTDFLPGGALGVSGGDEIIAPLLRAARSADLVVASRDFHPGNHCSFAVHGGPWPPHCVIGSPGAAIHPSIDAIAEIVVSKGMDPTREQYSAFDGTDLGPMLRARGIRRIVLGGLATDYCIRATALAARREGLDVRVLLDAVRAVDVQPGDGQRAIDEMRDAGVEIV